MNGEKIFFMEQNSLKKNAFYSVLKVFLSLVFPLITFPYASRILLPEGIGKVNFANTIISYFITIASLGIGGYATREAAKIRDDRKALSKLFKEIISINLFCCIVAYILFFIALNFIPKFNAYRTLLLVSSIKILFSVLGIEWIFTANEDFKFITIRTFFIQLFSLFYLFIFVHTADDIVHYVIFGLLTTVGCNVFNFFFVGKYVDLRFKTKLEIKKHLKAIIIFFGMTIVTSIYTMLDTAMLGFLSSDTEVGYYTASTKLGHMVLSMLTAITAVLLPRLTNYAQKNDRSSFNELVKKSANILLLLSIPMTCGLIILARPLVVLLSGEQYLPAVRSMQVISPILIIISFGSLTGVQILPSIGKEKISFYSYIAGAVTNVILNSILIPKYGALGAAIGTVGAESAVTSIQLFFTRKVIINKDLLITFLETIFASLIMIFVINIITSNMHTIILQLIVSFITGIIIYSLILVILRNKYFLFYKRKVLYKL
jgi:O-antigen/teichoic acid export membrane protein